MRPLQGAARLTAADLADDPRFAVIGFKAGETMHEAGGCERCGGTGYRGRNGVFEILEMTDEVRKLIGPQTDSHAIDAAAMARRHDHDARGCGRQMPRRGDHRARGFPRHDRSVIPMPSYRYRALNGNGELVSGAIAASAPGDVAQRIERLGLVLVDNVTLEESGGAAAQPSQPLQQAQGRGRHDFHPRPRAAAARRRADQ